MDTYIDLTDESEHEPPPALDATDAIPPAESVRGKHVLIVGINYAPEPTGIAPYTTQMAEHLARSAASVTVLTGLPCYPAWEVAAGYGGVRSHERINGVNVIRLAHHVPKQQTALRRGAYEASFMLHAAAVRLNVSPDVVLAVTPALGGAVVAGRIARRHKARLVIVVQDLMGKAAVQSGISGGASVAAVTGRLERWALRQADAVAVVAEAFRSAVCAYGVHESRISVLRNWSHISPPRRSRRDVRAELGWAPSVIVALHTGNMGLKQDLGNVVEAARLSRSDPSLLWVLMGDGSQREALRDSGGDLANLVFLPPCDGDAYADVLAAADILLLNEKPSVGEMSLPSKLTSYFASGRPVVGAVQPGGATAEELRVASGALMTAAGAPEDLLTTVRALSDDPARRRMLGSRNQTYAWGHLTERAALARLDRLLAFS